MWFAGNTQPEKGSTIMTVTVENNTPAEGETPATPAAPKIEPHPCACPCGEIVTTKAKFRPGHDQRLKGLLAEAGKNGENWTTPDGRSVGPVDYAREVFSPAAVSAVGRSIELRIAKADRAEKAKEEAAQKRAEAEAEKVAKAEAAAAEKAAATEVALPDLMSTVTGKVGRKKFEGKFLGKQDDGSFLIELESGEKVAAKSLV